jgi:hypothetical protein
MQSQSAPLAPDSQSPTRIVAPLTSVRFLSSFAWQRRPSSFPHHKRQSLSDSVPIQLTDTHIICTPAAARQNLDTNLQNAFKLRPIHSIKITFPAAREPTNPLKFSMLPAKLSDFSEVIKVDRTATAPCRLRINQ